MRTLITILALLFASQAYAQPSPSDTSLNIFRTVDLDEADVAVKATRGQVYGWFLQNTSAGVRYFKLYNATAASVTVGTTTPVITIGLPAGASANVMSPMGILFSTAITAACVTGVADNSAGAPGANECVANIFYK